MGKSLAVEMQQLGVILGHGEVPVSPRLRRQTSPLYLDEPVLRLAETLAGRYCISVPQLIAAVLLDHAEREMPGEVPPASGEPRPAGEDSRVIDITTARRRRRWRGAKRFPEAR